MYSSTHTSDPIDHSVSAASVGFAYKNVDDSLLMTPAERHVFKTGIDKNGRKHSYVQLIKGDGRFCFDLSEKIRAEAPNSLIYRSEDTYERLIGDSTFNGSGSMMIGLVDDENHLVGFGGLELMDDESDPGSGPVVHYKGRKNHEEQAYLKSLGILEAFQGNGHFTEFFKIRSAIGKMTGRDFLVLKTADPTLAEIYENKFDFINLSKNGHPDFDLVYESEEAKQDRVVDVLVLELNKFEENTAGIVMPKLSILGHDAPAQHVYH